MRIVIIVAIAGAVMSGAALTATAATVTLSPLDNVQGAVDINPAGTSFVLRSGIYRETSLVFTKDGDSLIGQPGAIMDGSKVLSRWTKVSIGGVDYWTTAGGKPLLTPPCGAPASCCFDGYPGCSYVQNLYVDNIDYKHVTSLAELSGGSAWYYDFEGIDGGTRNSIYLAGATNPNSHLVELSDKAWAVRGPAARITIKNLIVE